MPSPGVFLGVAPLCPTWGHLSSPSGRLCVPGPTGGSPLSPPPPPPGPSPVSVLTRNRSRGVPGSPGDPHPGVPCRTRRSCGRGTRSAWPAVTWWWTWGASTTRGGTATTTTRGETPAGDSGVPGGPWGDRVTPQVLHGVHAEPAAGQALEHKAEQRRARLLSLRVPDPRGAPGAARGRTRGHGAL